MPQADESSTGGTPVADDSSPKVLEWRWQGATVKLKHLPLGVLADIAKDHEIAIWSVLVDGPLGFLPPRALEDLFLACAKITKTKAPKLVTADMALNAFHLVADDEPDIWIDGRPQVGSPSTT